jgi:hypothetical protein
MKRLFTIFFICAFKIISAQYNNEDFEISTPGNISSSNQVTGWRIFNALNDNFGAVCITFCDSLKTTINSAIINHPLNVGFVDTLIGSQYPIFSVFGQGLNAGGGINYNIKKLYGNSFFRLGAAKTSTLSTFQQLTKKTKITPLNCVFRYAYLYAGVGSQASCCYGALFKIRVKNLSNITELTNFSLTVNPPPVSIAPCLNLQQDLFFNAGTNINFNGGPGAGTYTKWKLMEMDFTNYIGDSIQIDFVNNERQTISMASYGYTYLDCESRPGLIYANGKLNTNGTFTACSNAILSAIPNYNYLWCGPNNPTLQISNSPTINVPFSGVYYLTIFQGTTAIGTQSIDVNVKTPMPVNFTSTNDTICSGQSTTLTINYNTIGHLTTYSWSTGSIIPSIVVAPTITTTYFIDAIDTAGCYTFYSKNINVMECTKVKENLRLGENLKIYPNPNSGNFYIVSTSEQNLEICDSFGRLVELVTLNSKNNYRFQITGFKAGLYFVKHYDQCFKLTVFE